MPVFKILVALVVSLACSPANGQDLRVLFFTQEGCPPCRQTEPNIDRLGQTGVAVSKIHLEVDGQYASQCGVTQTPTIMLVENNQVLARYSGAMSFDDLQQMIAPYRSINASPAAAISPVQQMQAVRPANVNQNPPAALVSTRQAESRSNVTNELSGTGQLAPEELATQATVRLRVEDGDGIGYATGTVIHRAENEALVLTCGHVFRDSQGKGTIHVDLGFQTGEPVSVVGQLISYDAKSHDIALVAIPCPLPIVPVPVAPEALVLQSGDRMFSLGCDQGAAPSVRPTALKSVTRYSGVAKYDIVGRPIDGRSGGGLFTLGGQLVGVCNAAAVEIDEGIYTGLESVYWQFASSNLTHLFRPQTTPGKPAADVQFANNGIPAVPETVQTSAELLPGSTDVAIQHAIFRGDTPPARNAGFSSPASISTQSAPTDTPVEIIVVIRSANPAENETFSIQNPDPAVIDGLIRASQASNQQQAVKRLASLPELQPATRESNGVRSQSPH